MIINHNLGALNTYNQLNLNSSSMNKSLQKLSSGYRINSAADDAAGLAISEKMRSQIRGLDQAGRNAQDAISLVQTAEGALEETTNIMQRMRELAVQSASDTNTEEDRANLQDEVDALVKEINRIASTTEFNTKKLLNGSMGTPVTAAVATVQTNTSLNAATTTGTALTALTDTAGNSLGIQEGDTITVSYIKDGELVSDTLEVAAATALTDIDALVADADLTIDATTNALVATATAAGIDGAFYGLTITVTNTAEGGDGDTNTTATDALSGFKQTTAAANVRLDGSATVLIGANSGQSINIFVDAMDATTLGVQGLQINTQESADISLKAVDTALSTVASTRSRLGAVQNRLEYTINNLTTSSENLTAAESRIRDVDMASEMAEYTKLSVLTQAATAMLAQANQQPQQVLTLLQ